MLRLSWKKWSSTWVFFGSLFALLLGLDQWTKEWAVANLEPGKGPDFGWTLSYNDGIAFGIDVPMWLIIGLTFVVLALGTYLVLENKLWQDRWHLSGLALMLAGAIGNLIDRFRWGYVVDFIKVYWWPTFNVADMCIVAAVILFSYEFLIREDAISKI